MITIRLKSLNPRTVRAAIRRAWLRLTAPRICRQRWNPRDGRRGPDGRKGIRICDMDDAHLLNALHYYTRRLIDQCGPEGGAAWAGPKYEGLLKEARRRRLPTITKPDWLLKKNRAFGEGQRRRNREIPDTALSRVSRMLPPRTDADHYSRGFRT